MEKYHNFSTVNGINHIDLESRGIEKWHGPHKKESFMVLG